MKITSRILVLTTSLLGAYAHASSTSDLMVQLAKELPARPTPYVGKVNGRACQVDVKTTAKSYAVTVTLANGQKGSFYIDADSKVVPVYGFEEHADVPSYAGHAQRKEFRTYVQVETGSKVEYQETYGSFADKTFIFQIKDISTVRIPRWKIYVGTMNAGSQGFGVRTCELDLQSMK